MTAPEFLIVGRVRKAHGIRGELVVEPITDGPDAIFAPGRRVLAGNARGDLSPDRRELHVATVRPKGQGLLVKFDEIADRTAAEVWRGRYFLRAGQRTAAARRTRGLRPRPPRHARRCSSRASAVGQVREVYELPQGFAIDVARDRGTVLVPFDERVVTGVDREARVITIDPPAGLLD